MMMCRPISRRPFNDLIIGFERLVLASCAILFFSACADGYPTEDELAMNPVAMNQVERLEAMNRLGQQAHPDLTWLYRAMPGCSLQWTVDGADADQETFSLPLWGADVDVSFDKADQIYGVQVQPADVSELEELTLLLSKRWVDALALGQLVRLFQAGCKASSAPVPPGNPGQS
jgi:hypothetical protein